MNNSAINILVLDDDPLVLRLLARMLESLGYNRVSTCDSAERALELMDQSNVFPDLILLDINMPKMDGLEFVRHLVKRRYAGSLILISGEDKRQQQAAAKLVKAYHVPVLGYMGKPPSRETLAGLIGKWAPRQPSQPQARKKIYSADEVRRAISNDELVNYYQPKVDLTDCHVVGVEALLRWLHPEDGLVLPDQFIGVAEEHGLIDDITRVGLTLAVNQIKAWQKAGLMLPVAVNLSMGNLHSLDFVETVVDIVASAGVPPQLVELEVTESKLTKDLRITLEVLSRLRMKRFRLSLDDFGNENSSLARLRDLPFDELKIDRHFVHGAWDSKELQLIFGNSLKLANQLGVAVVAEGIEDRADWNFVRMTTCQIAQGHYIARPMPAADLPGWMDTWQKLQCIPRNVRECSKLFEMACRIAVDAGPFRMSWIGLIDKTRGVIVPHTRSTDMDSGIDDAILRNEPSVASIQSGTSFVCNDIDNDTHSVPWREAAVGNGYHACIALPLKQEGSIIGAFSFYLDQPGSITPEVIQRATMLAEDISSLLVFIDENDRRERRHAELQELAAFHQSALENERKRIARELHDELGQTLTAMRFELKWLNEHVDMHEQEIRDRMHALQGVLDNAVDTVRSISEDLRPGVLDDLGLAAAIEHQAQKFIKQTGIACELRMSQSEFDIGEQEATTMFRIVQESLTNVARHSGASSVLIDLRELGDQILLIVQDNGCGLPAQLDSNRKSYGLPGMRERVRMLNGTLDIFNEEGAGVRIEACIPKHARRQER